MLHIGYETLENIGDGHRALTDTLAQLRPYHRYLSTAIKATEERKPVIGWRQATQEETSSFQQRLLDRYKKGSKRSASGKRRDKRSPKKTPQGGFWIVLEAVPWRQEETDKTFEAFWEAREVFDSENCTKTSVIDVLDFDREGNALYLSRIPDTVEPNEEPPEQKPEAQNPFGQLLWLRPNTYQLKKQQEALRTLENRPGPNAAPLIRLTASGAAWPHFAPENIAEEDWAFLQDISRSGIEQQRDFVEKALSTPDFALLEGPPGSGKTTAICELIVQLAKRGKRVMLAASTHVAVDNVLERLIAWQETPGNAQLVLPVRIGEERNITSDEIVPWTFNRLKNTWKAEIRDFLEQPLGSEPAAKKAQGILSQALNKDQDQSALIRLILDSSNLICGTTIGILQHPLIKDSKAKFEAFDYLILDEASKTTFSEFLVPAIHARRWAIVGDMRQLSPYVDEIDLADNIRNLLSENERTAALHCWLADRPKLRPAQRSLLLSSGAKFSELLRKEAAERKLAFADLDHCEPRELNGRSNCIPELLFADLVVGSEDSLQRFERRLPSDLLCSSLDELSLPAWEARRKLFTQKLPNRRHKEERLLWENEVAWRLVRSYELRQNQNELKKYQQEIDKLLPKTFGNGLPGKVTDIRRVAFPSILELLQSGFEKLPGWEDRVALTDGLPCETTRQRLVSLAYQHRMHPEIAAFPREAFYAQKEHQAEATLLRDAQGIERARDWSYREHRAIWQSVLPRKKDHGNNATNVNPAEADRVLAELERFTQWTENNPRPGGKPWEVAILTFYRGQEAELRKRLQKYSRLRGNSRNFYIGGSGQKQAAVHATLCTVDRFQGHEADLVLLSFVKSGSVGFLNSPNRLNVALTRARYGIVLFGDRRFFRSERCRSELLRNLAHSTCYADDIGWGDK